MKDKAGNSIKLHVLIIISSIFFLYKPVINFEYVGLDDTSLISDNKEFYSDISNLPKIFTRHVFAAPKQFEKRKDYYRPMLTLSLMLETQIGKASPKVYHFFNIIYHIIASVLMLVLLNQLGVKRIPSLILTLFFALHPLFCLGVSWIPGRNDSLLAIFIFSGFYNWLLYEKSRETKYLIYHLLFIFLAFLTKETAVIFCAVIFIYSWLTGRKNIISKKYLLTGLAYVVLFGILLALRFNALKDAPSSIDRSSVFSDILENSPLLLQYFSKIILPFDLHIMSSNFDNNYFLICLSILLISGLIYFSKNIRWNFVLFGAIWFLIFIIPTLSVTLYRGFEHRLYVPVTGIILILSEIKWIKEFSFRKWKISNYIITGYIITLAILSFMRLPEFHDRFSFWNASLKSKDYRATSYLNLGKFNEELGRYDTAITYYKKGLEEDSCFVNLNNNIGGAYLYMQKYREAEPYFYRELKKYPGNVNSIYNLGVVYLNTNRTDEAVKQWKKTLELDSDFIFAYQELAKYYLAENDTAEYLKCIRNLRIRGY